jgi:hypothetical protein
MINLSNIRGAISSKLTSILANKARVYSYYESNPAQYPAVIMDISSSSNDFLSNVENMASITFQIIILVDQSDQNGLSESEATSTLDNLIDIITYEVEKDYSLGGVVDYCIPTVGRREILTIPNGVAKAQYINLTIKQSVMMI